MDDNARRGNELRIIKPTAEPPFVTFEVIKDVERRLFPPIFPGIFSFRLYWSLTV